MAAGRPSKYKETINKQMLAIIGYWVMKGTTEEGIAKRLGIAYSTLKLWKKKYDEFSAALKQNTDVVDDMVEGSLFKKAMLGDTTACIFWLKNRRRGEWKDKWDIEHSGSMNVTIVDDI